MSTQFIINGVTYTWPDDFEQLKYVTAWPQMMLDALTDFTTKRDAAASSATTATTQAGIATTQATTATTQAATATTQAGNAAASATLASQWATLTSEQVAATDYSAKEFAQGTQAGTGGSAKNWAQQTGADVTGATANSRSAKSWAQDNLAGATLGGSAKDWAQSASSPDGTTTKSAKSYATDAAGSAATATTQANNAAASATSAAVSYRCYYGGTAGGTANALTITTGLSLSTIPTGARIFFRTGAAANTTAATATVDSCAAVAIRKNNVALSPGDLPANTDFEAVFDGTNLRLVSGGGTGVGNAYATIFAF